MLQMRGGEEGSSGSQMSSTRAKRTEIMRLAHRRENESVPRLELIGKRIHTSSDLWNLGAMGDP